MIVNELFIFVSCRRRLKAVAKKMDSRTTTTITDGSAAAPATDINSSEAPKQINILELREQNIKRNLNFLESIGLPTTEFVKEPPNKKVRQRNIKTLQPRETYFRGAKTLANSKIREPQEIIVETSEDFYVSTSGAASLKHLREKYLNKQAYDKDTNEDRIISGIEWLRFTDCEPQYYAITHLVHNRDLSTRVPYCINSSLMEMIEEALKNSKSEIVEEISIDDSDFIQNFYCSLGNITMEIHLRGDLRRRKFWSDMMQQSENQTTSFLKDYMMKLKEPLFSFYTTAFKSFVNNAPSDGTCDWHSLACMEFSWNKCQFSLRDSWYERWLTSVMGKMTVDDDSTSAYYRTSHLLNRYKLSS